MENVSAKLVNLIYNIETYSIFSNVDRSILLINPAIQKFGYKFIELSLLELEKDFSSLFLVGKEFKSEIEVTIEAFDVTISNEFYTAYTRSRIFDHPLQLSNEHYFLKKIENSVARVENNFINNQEAINILGNLSTFTSALIQQLRLFKNGDVDSKMKFQIREDSREMGMQIQSSPGRTFGLTPYTLTNSEAIELMKKLEPSFIANSLTELAITNFNLSYDITDVKTRFVTLMTCLESLFNQGRDQITHTVSRHLALIISRSEQDFFKNYSQIKKLYTLRSTIVHGDKTKEDINQATFELQKKVREAINFCLPLMIDKRQLFDKLNSFGFGNLEKLATLSETINNFNT